MAQVETETLPVPIFSLKRWGDMFAYGLIGTSVFLSLSPIWNSFWPSSIRLWIRDNPYVLDGGIFLVLFAANKLVGTRLRHFRHLLTYPPISVAILIALATSLIISAILNVANASSTVSTVNVILAGCIFTSAWCIQDIAEQISFWLTTRPCSEQKIQLHTSERQQKQTLSDSELIAWLQKEEPIRELEADFFGHHTIAETLLDRLERGENTIALHGAYGSGKSSVVAMATRLSKNKGQRFIFAEVSCWGFETASSAQEAILSALIHRMGEEVDCLSVRGIPSAYLDAVGAHITWFKPFGFLFEKKSPLQQLKRLSPLLAAIESRAVVVIEDADRNGSTFDISLIQALLVQFRAVEGLSFILAISSNQQIDFARVCDYLEIVPLLEKREVLSVVNQVRNYLIRTYPPAILLDKLEPLPEGDDDYPILSSFLTYYWPWHLALWGVLNNPRTLKHALRRVVAAWPQLSGEVRIDDLIGMAALRIGGPDAFTFFTHNFDYFKAASQKPDKNLSISTELPATLKQEWLALTENKRFDARSVAWLMTHLYTHSGAITGASEVKDGAIQTMDSERRGPVYAKRLFTESVAQDRVSDQSILKLIQNSQKDVSHLRELAKLITESEFASLAFENFARRGNYASFVLALQTEVFSRLRTEHSVRATSDNQPGFKTPWLLVRHHYPAGWEEWLAEELRRCVPHNIRLLNDIYHYWIGDEPFTAAQRESIRKVIYESIKFSWEQAEPIKVANAFDPAYPYSLSHLVFAFSRGKNNPAPYGTIEQWPWLGKVLVDAAKAAPSIMLPQIIMLLNTSSGDPALPRHAYDLSHLQFLFKDKQKNLLEQIAAGFEIPKEMPEDFQYTVKAGIQQAQMLLKSGNLLP